MIDSKWFPLILKVTVAVLVIAIAVSGFFVVRTALYKPTAPRTAAERAIMDGEEAVKANPKSVPARITLASAYAGVGRYGDAIEQLNIAVKLDPKSVQAHYILGVSYKEQGDYDSAVATLKKAASIGGEAGEVYSDIYYELGTTYQKKGDYRSAVTAFLESDRYEVTLYTLRELAISYEKIGAIEDAKLSYLNILYRDVENKEAIDALKRLGVKEDVIKETQLEGQGKMQKKKQ